MFYHKSFEFTNIMEKNNISRNSDNSSSDDDFNLTTYNESTKQAALGKYLL